ncbi:sigma factor-like helix-turn-helix DNA-binding protein [Brevundimonas aveniformis]|uniref:sigma factor-like helix-turn-helix DNA-binding protein n=1 Tax=Brevundimonas aveniformis TaxID=370977 RepID=UPI00249351DA|nr:sigma factor-like helix-turn-helix DNA-binding protein [Brevundimonas aveniformis]
MDNEVPESQWAEYLEHQRHADSTKLDDNAWAADATLEAILDRMESGRCEEGTPDASCVSMYGLRRNRASKYRFRRMMIESHRAILEQEAVYPSHLMVVYARRRFASMRQDLAEIDLSILCDLAAGYTYGEISVRRNINVNTVKARAMRARQKMVA